MKLQKYLDKKPLYYDKIDYTRMPRVYESVKKHIKIPKIIHVIGTNGKGTTGRFLASALFSLGFKVGHYTSPHILKFNERIWLNGFDVLDEALETAHLKLQKFLKFNDANSLSYFEYTTLLAMLVYENCNYVILEAGLGGEFDATAVFPKHLTLVTPIDIDHEAFLGSNVEEISTTKLNAIQNNAIIATQKQLKVYEVAKKISLEKKISIFAVDALLKKSDFQNIKILEKELSLAKYLTQNLALAISALNFLMIKYENVDFKDAKLFGRLSKISDNVMVDVGHNKLAAKSIAESLSGNKYIIIYNSYKDKDYQKILELLKPITRHVELIVLDEYRVESIDVLQNTLDGLGIKHTIFKEIKSEFNYLVFGSFSVVEQFLREYNG